MEKPQFREQRVNFKGESPLKELVEERARRYQARTPPDSPGPESPKHSGSCCTSLHLLEWPIFETSWFALTIGDLIMIGFGSIMFFLMMWWLRAEKEIVEVAEEAASYILE